MNKIKVYIVDDHSVVRHGISQVIRTEEDMVVSGESGELELARREISLNLPDIVLLDISLNDENGIELIQYLNTRHPGISVMVLSMHDEQIYVKCSLEAGAKGYFHKNDSVTNIPHAIRRIIEGGSYFSEEISDTILHVITNRQPTDEQINKLSIREKRIFRLLGEGKRRHHISELLYISPKTVSSHIEKIKTKLNSKTTDDVIQGAYEWVQQQNKQ